MCLLPRTTYILATLPKLSPRNVYEVASEYKRSKKLIDEGITTLFPYYKDRGDDHLPFGISGSTNNIIRIYEDLDDVELYNENIIMNSIGQYSQKNNIYISFPWLYDADIDNYLELVHKHRDEFENLSSKISLLTSKCNSVEELENTLRYEIDEALINIKISCEKEQAVLKRKGISTVMGIALTVLPIVFPDKIPVEFSTLFGGASLFSATDLVNDFISQKKLCNENPFWVIWKWKNSMK